jgi:hypothetical protein
MISGKFGDIGELNMEFNDRFCVSPVKITVNPDKKK